MITAFTVCSNNFLAQAKTMFLSLAKKHPEYRLFLFLVDEPDPAIDYSWFEPAGVIIVNEDIVPPFREMLNRYTIIEMNTAVRPYLFEYLQRIEPRTTKIFYTDPDLYFYGRLEVAEQVLDNDDIVITPHFLTPLPIDGKVPFENLALNYGTYNMGFFGIRPGNENTRSFLNWWKERTTLFGHVDPANGYFTDQIWFNLAPVFFERVHTLKHPGYNMAAWNLHERVISRYSDNDLILQSGFPLVVYHFSSWNPYDPGKLAQHYNRYDFDTRPDLKQLYSDYHQELLANRLEQFSKIPCMLPYNKKIVKRSPVKRILDPGVNVMRSIWKKI